METKITRRRGDSAPATTMIWLVRHGRTEWTAAGRRAGRADIKLDDVGRGQAAALVPALAGEPVDVIFASPLQRARQTAAPLAASRGVAAIVDDQLIEFDFGRFEGTVRSEVKLKLRRDYLYEPVPGGESLHDLWGRAGRVAERLRAQAALGNHVVVVSHKRFNRALVGVLEQRGFEESAADGSYRPAPGSILGLTVGDGRVISRQVLPSEPASSTPDSSVEVAS